MGCEKNAKYSRDDWIDILHELDIEKEYEKGKQLGKGDHALFSHVDYKDLKLVVPHRKDLSENEMSNICSNLVIIMRILGTDTSRFKHKEGVEGKIMKTVKNAEKDLCVLFNSTTKNCLGVRDKREIGIYMKKQMEKYQKPVSSEPNALD